MILIFFLSESKNNFRFKYDWIEYLSENLLKDKEIALIVIAKNALCFTLFDDSLKNDEDLVMVALKQNGNVLGCLSDYFRSNIKFVKMAFEQSKYSIQFACQELKNDSQFKI